MRFNLRINAGKHAGREIPIRGPRFLIGCADNCHLKIHASQASAYHCALLIQDDGIWVRDYGGGTIVSGTRIVDRRRLDHGDQLQIGSLHFELLIQEESVKGNDRVPDEGEILDILSQPVEGPAAPVAELGSLGNARSEPPKAPPRPHATTATPAEPDETGDLAADMLVKILKPKHAWKVARAPATKPSPPADDVEAPQFVGPEEIPAQGASVSAPRRRVIALPQWMFTAEGQLNPNVMFALGIWAGIGLCAAAFALLTITGRLRIVAD
jgi:predicted component of type VI protein secretion system